MPQTAPVSLDTELQRVTRAVDATLMALLPTAQGPEARLLEAMRYLAIGAGSHWRGFLAVQSGHMFGVDERAMLRVAAAIECLNACVNAHCALPAFGQTAPEDGQPPAHEAFDEAAAVLAGNGLMTLAYSILSSVRTCPDPFVRCSLVAHLADASGHAGLVGGQMIQRAAQDQETDIGTIIRLQRMKAGSLIAFCCESGALMARAGDDLVQAVNGYAHDLSLAMQIMDDLRDENSGDNNSGDNPAEADDSAAGSGPDPRILSGKATFVSVLGPERARSQAALLARQAIRHLDLFDEKADPLRQVAEFVLEHRF